MRSRNPWALLKGWLYGCFTELSAHPGNIPSAVYSPPWREARAAGGESWARAAQLPQGCALDTEITDHTHPSSRGDSSATDSSESELLS